MTLIPPAGSTFSPGQRFDVRLQADEIRGKPQRYSVLINGRDVTRELFGAADFQTFPLLDADGRPTAPVGGGITRRDWSFNQPGTYRMSATLTDSDGSVLSAEVNVEVLPIAPEPRAAKNIILFIGDGMGVAQRTAARILSKGLTAGRFNGRLEMDTFEANGFVMTPSRDSLVTDSSPSAAAYATGNKGDNSGHGVFSDNTGPGGGRATPRNNAAAAVMIQSGLVPTFVDNPRVENIAELLRRTRRMSIGLVSTFSLTDSTPGAFSSHTYGRYFNSQIAEQVFSSSPEVLLGAGTRYFVPNGNPLLGNFASQRNDARNIVEEFKQRGYTLVSTAAELRSVKEPGKLLGLFHPAQMASRLDRMESRRGNANARTAVGQFPDQPDLELMVEKALDVLSRNRDGFFLMVEAANIDRSLHRHDPVRAIYDTIELDRAVGVAKRWARSRNDTLIVVTGDHETAGLVLPGVVENGRLVSRFEAGSVGFTNYEDRDGDGFPDVPNASRGLALDFGTFGRAEPNPPDALPRDLSDLNPDASREPVPTYGEHTATDIFIAASGPGSRLFTSVMDNTEVFFKMLQALAWKSSGR